MKKSGLALKFATLANALLLVGAFVGCPARKDPVIIGTIAPPTDHFERIVQPIKTPPREDSDRFMPPAIAPPPIDFERFVPLPSPQDLKKDGPASR
jgi:hypothetical protein